jgi:hypothetical protein
LEISTPAAYHPIYIVDDLLQGTPVTALGSLPDSFLERKRLTNYTFAEDAQLGV